jgi:hypothetical protein
MANAKKYIAAIDQLAAKESPDLNRNEIWSYVAGKIKASFNFTIANAQSGFRNVSPSLFSNGNINRYKEVYNAGFFLKL